MTTQVHERIPATVLPEGRPRGPRGSWIVFLAATVLLALLIGIVAALLGNAMKAVSDARGLLGGAERELETAQIESAAAVEAEAEARAALEDKRAEAIAQFEALGTGTSFAANATLPIVAEVRALETAVDSREAAVADAQAAEVAARENVEAAGRQLTVAEESAQAVATPFWILTIASGFVLLVLATVAILRTRALRRRR